jgi:hypothetical protein
LKEITEKILILTSLLALCVVLPFDYFRKDRIDREIAQRIKDLEQEIRSVEGKDFSVELQLPERFTPRDDQFGYFLTNRILGGTCFYELHEIEDFLVTKLQDKDSKLVIYPPGNMTINRVADGVELTWTDNPQNQALLKKLMNNPLLSLNYKVYRWNSGRRSQPEPIALLPYDRNYYVDKGVGPLGIRYYYNVLTVYGGKIGEHATLIESQESETVDITTKDRFRLRIIHGTADRVQVEVSVGKGGNQISRTFSVAGGDEIGGWIDLPGAGRVDLTTTLKVVAIRTRDEIREVSLDHPVFNSDGSRSLDPITRRPVFQNKPVERNITVYSLECEDPWGNQWTIE